MKLLFSEIGPDYSRYLYPYVVWAVPEPGETPADLYEAGFHPAAPDLSRFTLCRHLRLPLAGWEPSSENRRILRKGDGIDAELVPRERFAFDEHRRSIWLEFATRRFGPGVMPGERLDALMNGRVVTHLLVFHDPGRPGRETGTVLLYLEPPRMAHYYYAFYDLEHPNPSLGLFMMTTAVRRFRDAGYHSIFLGTCYSERARYKTRFAGIEFFDGAEWSKDLDTLKFLIRRDAAARHLLQEPDFLERRGGMTTLGARTPFRHPPARPDHRSPSHPP